MFLRGHKVSAWLLLWIFPVQAEKMDLRNTELTRTPNCATSGVSHVPVPHLPTDCTGRIPGWLNSLLGGFFLAFPGLGAISSLLCVTLGQGQSHFLVTVESAALVLIA